MKIGQVATRAGVNIDTLRYYERRGLLAEPERRPSGYRDYPEETVPIIRFIKRAQDLGFTLNEIEELISLRDGGNGRRKGEIRALAEAKECTCRDCSRPSSVPCSCSPPAHVRPRHRVRHRAKRST